MGDRTFQKGAYYVRCGVNFVGAKPEKVRHPLTLSSCAQRTHGSALFAVRPRGSPSKWTLYNRDRWDYVPLFSHNDLDVVQAFAGLVHD